MRLELARSEVFLELARAVFREQSHIEPTMVTILSNFLTLIECERCQILLSDMSDPTVFKQVFDMSKKDVILLDDENQSIKLSQNALPFNATLAGNVAESGQMINLASDGFSESFMCMAIRDPDGKILGVISLIDKDDRQGYGGFSANDERFVEAFSLFCGMAIRNAAQYEKAVVSEAKLQVAFEVMNYQAVASENEATKLAEENQVLPAASSFRLDSFDFNYLDLTDHETLRVSSCAF